MSYRKEDNYWSEASLIEANLSNATPHGAIDTAPEQREQATSLKEDHSNAGAGSIFFVSHVSPLMDRLLIYSQAREDEAHATPPHPEQGAST